MPITRATISTLTQTAAATIPPAPAVAGPASTFVFRPSGSTGPGIYNTWPSLMNAVNQVPGQKFITYDDSFSPCEIPAGAWDVDSCVISTVPRAGSGRLFIANGAILIFNRLDFVDANIESLATAPVTTFGGSNTGALRLDEATITCLATGSFLRVMPGTDAPAVLMTNTTSIGDGTHPVFQVDASAELDITAVSGSIIAGNATSGAGTVNVTLDMSVSIDAGPQAATFSLFPLSDAHNVPYTPTTLGNWSNNNPRTLQLALDRIAAKIGPIP